MKAQTKYPTCEDRIAEEAEGRLEDIRRFNHKYQRANEVGEWRAGEKLLQRQQEMLLSVERKRYYRVQLSTGGPADWFEVYAYEDGEIQYIEYHFSDWFDHAERNLTGAEFDAVREWLQAVVYLEEGA